MKLTLCQNLGNLRYLQGGGELPKKYIVYILFAQRSDVRISQRLSITGEMSANLYLNHNTGL